MSLKKIIEKIADDADAEVEKILRECRNKAEEIKNSAKQESEHMAADLIKDAEKKGQMEANRLITQARLFKRIELLEKKKQLIDEVLDRAFQEVLPGNSAVARKIIMKDGEKEEYFDTARLKEELRPRLESMIAEALKI